jgi:DNA polymerase-3 subunit epsilon
MLHKLFTLTRPLFVLDCETTGTDTQQSRIVELGLQKWTADGMVEEYRTLVNPNVLIPPEVIAIHGITDEMVRTCQVCDLAMADHALCDHPFHRYCTFAQLAPDLVKDFVDCDFAGKNIRFDLRITAAEMVRAGQVWSYAGARIIDAERLEQLAVPRTLSDLHEKYTGAKHDGAHGALSDVKASATVIVKQLVAHPTLPRDLEALHAAQWPGYIDSEGKFGFVNGVPTVRFGKWRDKPMARVDSDYWTWMAGPKADFTPEVKAIAREAAARRFPVAKET